MGLVKHWIVRDNAGLNPRIVFDEAQLAAYRNGGDWKIEGPFGSASAEGDDERLALTIDEAAEILGWLGTVTSEGFDYDGDLAARLAAFAGDAFDRERFGAAS